MVRVEMGYGAHVLDVSFSEPACRRRFEMYSDFLILLSARAGLIFVRFSTKTTKLRLTNALIWPEITRFSRGKVV